MNLRFLQKWNCRGVQALLRLGFQRFHWITGMKIHLSPTALDSDAQVISVAHLSLLYQRHLLSSFLAKSQESGLSSILTCQACHPGYAAETFWSKYFQKCLATLQAWPPLNLRRWTFFARLITFEVESGPQMLLTVAFCIPRSVTSSVQLSWVKLSGGGEADWILG